MGVSERIGSPHRNCQLFLQNMNSYYQALSRAIRKEGINEHLS
jgi:hypothetical protein